MFKSIKYLIFLVISVTLINLIFLIVFSSAWHINFNSFWSGFTFYLTTSLFSSIVISLVIIFTAPVLKDLLVVYRRLLRFENLSHPLLLKLSLEAPGTYHHSMGVANLAYRAAKSIGGDSLLTRIGSYYHDIGKVIQPEYYIENQKEGQNIHSEIADPKQSSKIILEHVKNGLKIAEEHNLPKEVMAFIAEHQGTQINYFFQQAKNNGLKVKKSDFRYPGPKPLSRETAIVMLADAIEAKIRLLDKVTPEAIREIISSTIEEKQVDNQLDLSGLTARELEIIRKSFIDTLEVMYHQRINYQKPIFGNQKR